MSITVFIAFFFVCVLCLVIPASVTENLFVPTIKLGFNIKWFEVRFLVIVMHRSVGETCHTASVHPTVMGTWFTYPWLDKLLQVALTPTLPGEKQSIQNMGSHGCLDSQNKYFYLYLFVVLKGTTQRGFPVKDRLIRDKVSNSRRHVLLFI